MPRLILPAVALALALASPVGAAEKVTSHDRFQLWNGCQPLSLVAGRLKDAAKSIGLSKSRIETAVRSRLRAARIYTDNPLAAYVYVNVHVVGAAFSSGLDLSKWVRDEASGLRSQTVTWQTGGTGTHGKSADYILSAIRDYTDEFIDEYLRVNADAC